MPGAGRGVGREAAVWDEAPGEPCSPDSERSVQRLQKGSFPVRPAACFVGRGVGRPSPGQAGGPDVRQRLCADVTGRLPAARPGNGTLALERGRLFDLCFIAFALTFSILPRARLTHDIGPRF